MAPDARPPDAGNPPAQVEAVDGDTSRPPEVPQPFPLRPMTVADILDGGIAVIKAAPRTMIVIAATFIIPLELVSAWVQRDSLADRGLAGAISAVTDTSRSSTSGLNVSGFALIAAAGFVLSLVTGAIAHVLSAWYADATVEPADAIRASIRRAPALFVAWIIVHVVEVPAFLLLLVPVLFVMPVFLVVAPAIVIEHLGPWAGVRRSWRLTRVRYGAVVGAGLLIGIVSTLLTVALSGLGLAFSVFSFGWIIDVICRGASALITVPFVAASTTLVYLDLRIRAEGLDLELDITEHFRNG